MDESSYLSCSICEEPYSKDRVPRSLNCGHSFCHDCLSQICATDKKCPECRRLITAQKAEEIIVNYSLLRLAAAFAEQQIRTDNQPLVELESAREGEKCKEHGSVMFFMCMKCEVWVCRDCLVVDHPDPPRGQCRIVSAKTALAEMKISQKDILHQCARKLECMGEIQQKDAALLTRLENYYRNEIQRLEVQLRKLHPEQQRLINRRSELGEMKQNIELSLSLLDRVTSTAELNSFIERVKSNQNDIENLALRQKQGVQLSQHILQNNTQMLKVLLQDKCPLYASSEENGEKRWSPVVYEDGHVLLYCLRKGKPPENGITLPYEGFRKLVPQDSPLIFMDVGWDGQSKGRVYVRMFGDTPRGRQAVFLCSGERGPSYRNTVFYKYDHMSRGLHNLLRGGDYENNDGSGGRAIVGGISSGGIYQRQITEGLMVSWSAREHWRLGSFDFYLSDCPYMCDYSGFGQVEKGLDILKRAATVVPVSKTSLMDCGLVITAV